MANPRDEVIDAIAERVCVCLKGKAGDSKFLRSFHDDEVTRQTILDWIDLADHRLLVFSGLGGDKFSVSYAVPQKQRKKGLYFLKPAFMTGVTTKALNTQVICGELSAQSLNELSLLSHEVVYELLRDPANRADWSGPTAQEVLSDMNSYLASLYVTVGQTQGRTLLPMPPPAAFDVTVEEKERVHLLEDAIVQWSNQIQHVLKTGPDSQLESGEHPGPMAEIEFWDQKAEDLNAIQEQLTSDEHQRVVTALNEHKSVFGVQFDRVLSDVREACEEANDNVRFLKAVRPHFERLRDELDFDNIPKLFLPMFHTLLLIFQYSLAYNTRLRLTVVLQKCCNELINQAQNNVSGETVFRFIDEENVSEVVRILDGTIAVCESFKDTFEQTRERASQVLNDQSWEVPRDVVFARLDAFVERCEDIREFSCVVQDFSKLEKIHVGGTKGQSLTDSVHQVFSDFTTTVERFKALGYDIMDITVPSFDDDIYRFRMRVKAFERRLAAVLTTAFDDSASLNARFQMLESFEGLLDRPIIKDELDSRRAELLAAYRDELLAVQAIFHEYRAAPRIDRNMPPIAGALAWCRALRDRVEEPLPLLRQYTDSIRDSPLRREVEKLYATASQQLRGYENAKIEEWKVEIDESSTKKLNKPLLRRDNETRRLAVNFDDALVRLLREVKYFFLLNLDVPRAARAVFERREEYRQRTGNLDLIVHMYNEMEKTLNEVERPLVQQDIESIDVALVRGIVELNWNSESTAEFISSAMELTTTVYDKVKMMHDNKRKITEMMAKFAEDPMVERKTKPLSPSDFGENLARIAEQRQQALQKHQKAFLSLVYETREALGADDSTPEWHAYVAYLENAVQDGLAKAVIRSIDFLSEQLDPERMQSSSVGPMLEVKLGLYANDVLYNASDSDAGNAMVTNPSGSDAKADGEDEDAAVDSAETVKDVWQIVRDWATGFLDVGLVMKRLDGSDFRANLRKNEDILRAQARLHQLLDRNYKKCEEYRASYLEFSELWTKDRQAEFDEFLERARERMRADREREREAHNRDDQAFGGLMAAAAAAAAGDDDGDDGDDAELEDAIMEVTLPLDDFEEQIMAYKSKQQRVAARKTPVEMDWLKINVQPLKQALATWINRWVQTYTSYLYNHVTGKLNDLESMMHDVNQGLKSEVPKGDSDKLKTVLGYIHDVKSSEKRTMAMFAPLRETVNVLKRHGRQLDEYELKLLTDAPMKWDSTVNRVYKVKEQVNHLQNEEVDKIKQQVESFEAELQAFKVNFREAAPFSYDMTVDQAYELIYQQHLLINEIEARAAKLNDLERVFELTVSTHRQAASCRLENGLLKRVWDVVAVVRNQFDAWKGTLWDQIDTDALGNATKKLSRFISGMPTDVKSWDVYTGLLEEVKNLQIVLPLVTQLRSPAMGERHWKELMTATGKHFVMGGDFCLRNLIELELHNYVTDVEEIVQLAEKESKIAVQLSKIEEVWASMMLEFSRYKQTDIMLIKASEELTVALEEHMASLQSMQGLGKFVEFFIDQVTKWQQHLGIVETVLYDWLDVQARWSSLETIFRGSKDIRIQLPEDSERFDEIHTSWVQLQKDAQEEANVVKACSVKGRSELLETMKAGLEQCEKSLNQYLETKRMSFPRFYFLSNAALLDILSNGYNPLSVQKHLGDCFDNIAKLKFEGEEALKERQKIAAEARAAAVAAGEAVASAEETTAEEDILRTGLGMYSKSGGEYVDFVDKFMCDGPVEDWLVRLVDMMRKTLMDILDKARTTAEHWEIDKPRRQWLFDYPAQIALTASQLMWTEEVEQAFEAFEDGQDQAMREYSKVVLERLNALIKLVQDKLTKRDRTKIITLITVDVHNRDVVQRLIDDRVTEASAFAWQSQMRYVWDTDANTAVVKVADAPFRYSYEYVGNTGRLVITPLTDRCYITLTQALRLIMGGAPAGPAGTGKTETTKDLGRAMGLPVYVFNCSEQMNVQSMGAVFKGLCQTGAWGCFDEFNRIPIEVLSVVSTQFASILNALREKRDEFDFMGELVKLVDTVGAFITMNPGYAGRTELPENLKALFRSCAMVVPDIQLICENMLMSEGFITAQRLSKKFTTLYSLSKELLSKQMHYDWGLRATKAVLRVAGGLKRAEPNVEEGRILMRALRDFNLPKLVDDDKPIFVQLVKDLFPAEADTKRKVSEEIRSEVAKAAKQRHLQADDTFVLKATELAELLDIRHSVFVIGVAGTGKSEIWRTLFRAFDNMGRKTVTEVLNPKSVRNNELYGWLTKTDWHDGILSTMMRNMSRNLGGYNDSQDLKVIVLDGDIDPEWIESLNTVMDDNKVLTLVSNERIPLTAPMRLLFEISNLDNATPATVSRAGILYINKKDVGSKPFLDTWIDQRNDDHEKSSLLALVNKYITPETVHEMIREHGRIIPVSEMSMIKTLCYLLEGLLANLAERRSKQRGGQADAAAEREVFEANFVFATIWAFGGALVVDKQSSQVDKFDAFWRNRFTAIKFPKEGTVFDYFPDERGQMVPWQGQVPDYEAPEDAYLVTKVFVPTVETVRLRFIVDLLAMRQRPVMLVGTAGTGKTVLLTEYLRSLDDPYTFASINLNAYTDAKSLQAIMESYIDKRSGRTYGPEGNKKLIYFIDDINMPRVDTYGTQSPSALIRQQLDYKCWYDTTKLDRKIIQDVQYLACMNPTSGSFTINSRLQGQFATFGCQLPTMQNLKVIYGQVMANHLQAFAPAVANMCDVVTEATIKLHEVVSNVFLPSSTKFHYQFNLRDLSCIFQGLCMSTPKTFTPARLLKLWRHEATRVLSDRLITPRDVERFVGNLEKVEKAYFKDVQPDPTPAGVDEDDEPPLLFTTFAGKGDDSGNYAPVESFSGLKKTLQRQLEEYNETNAVMNLELFGMAMEHVCRITRIIENPRGSALLVGVGGSGKQSLARLASWICGYTTFQISVTQSYGLNDFKTDLQELYRKCGVKGNQVTFLLTDAQIVDDEWLVYVNDLLSSGYIPDLFTSEDKDGIFAALRSEAKAAGVPDTRGAMQDFFIERVRANLHVVLCFSPVGEVFRVRCRKFPALINCTSIDWFHPWPREALVSVANRFLTDVPDLSESLRASIAEHMAHVHLSVNAASERFKEVERRYNYTTPKSFLELIAFYKVLLDKKRAHLQQQIERLEKGISTLMKTERDVGELKADLESTLVRVEEKREAADVLIKEMGVERSKVEKAQEIAEVEKAKAQTVSAEANRVKEECDTELQRAKPAMIAARNAVDCLSKKSLTNLKSFNNPTKEVLEVTKAVQILKDHEKRNFSWKAAKSMMKDVGSFINQLRDLDKENIPDDIISRLRPILAQDFFSFEGMKSKSEAAANLCNYVVNVVEYNTIYREVAPKMAALEDATAKSEKATAKLESEEAKVAAMEAKLRGLNEKLTAAVDQKNEVEAEAERCNQRLALAERLVNGLADENQRWGASVEDLHTREETLKGNVLLAAAFVSYIGAFNQMFRQQLWQDVWLPDLKDRQIPLTEGVTPLAVLANDSDFARWKNQGLPADPISLENGAIITQCTRWPLLIDPQLQGIKWIKSRTPDLVVVQIGQKRWLSTIVNAVQNGQSVLIESIGEHLEATLDPILSRSVIKRGRSSFIKVGSEEVPYDDNFSLVLQTKLSNPHYKPEIAAQCTLINFIVTEDGLEEQLLALVVNREKRELEEERQALVRTINEYMVTLTDLENELLMNLSNAPEDILSDVALIEGLEKTKETAIETEEKVKQAREQEDAINKIREEFRGVAAEGSYLYFLLIQLNAIDHMYQYSLDAFVTFFFKAMDRATASDVTAERVAALRESIRITVFQWVNRGLFEKHKLIFSSQLCFKLMQKGVLKEEFNPVWYDFFIRAPQRLTEENKTTFLPDTTWYTLQALSQLDGFKTLSSDLVGAQHRFEDWYNKQRPESEALPAEWRKLDDKAPFKKLMIVRTLRNDRMTTALTEYVAKSVPNGRQFTECDSGKSFLDVLNLSFNDSNPNTPIFFILSPGADPVNSVETIAKKRGMYDSKFHRVALGQGQDVVAMNRLEIAYEQGHWVVLENIHLMPRWLPHLENKLDEYAIGSPHEDFRIFLSAEPSNQIPIGLLERSIKLTNEPPRGLKANLKRAFAEYDKEEFEFKDNNIKSILFGLAHFHSIIVERIKFGAQGWNRAYPFNTGDLMNSATVLSNYVSEAGGKIPWSDLRYIFGEILYGGHITDDWDRLLCISYLNYYMCDDLFEEMELFPFSAAYPDDSFLAPPAMDYDDYFRYIDNELGVDTPVAFGLHPNAEIGVKTQQAEDLFSKIVELQPRGAGASGDNEDAPEDASPHARVESQLDSIQEKVKAIDFNLEDIAASIVDDRGPYQNVFLQECERMNILCAEIVRSLHELHLGLEGELQMSANMEALFDAIFIDRVPASWEKLAYPSLRALGSWVDNLVQRAAQLQTWVENPTEIPLVIDISYFFNPQSLLTAIKQVTCQKLQLELDALEVMTDVTRKTREDIDTPPREGAYLTGLFMEGARWDLQTGMIAESIPREMFCPMPVINAKAIIGSKMETSGVFACPMYVTARRGPTFIATATLRSKEPSAKWTLAGVVLLTEAL